jgi:hypothetical protein
MDYFWMAGEDRDKFQGRDVLGINPAGQWAGPVAVRPNYS